MKLYKYTIGVILLSLTAGLFANTNTYPKTADWKRSYNEKKNPTEQLDLPELDPSFNYTTFGVALPFPIPGVGIGYRNKFDNNAVDISAHFATAIIASAISVNLSYLTYVNKKDFYLGAGASLGLGFSTTIPVDYGIRPFLSFGKENETNFHQVKATMIVFGFQGTYLAPYLTYEYGFKF